MNITNLSAQQLRQAAGIKDQLAKLENQLAKLLGSVTGQLRTGRLRALQNRPL
jgi:hypothetical protein